MTQQVHLQQPEEQDAPQQPTHTLGSEIASGFSDIGNATAALFKGAGTAAATLFAPLATYGLIDPATAYAATANTSAQVGRQVAHNIQNDERPLTNTLDRIVGGTASSAPLALAYHGAGAAATTTAKTATSLASSVAGGLAGLVLGTPAELAAYTIGKTGFNDFRSNYVTNLKEKGIYAGLGAVATGALLAPYGIIPAMLGSIATRYSLNLVDAIKNSDVNLGKLIEPLNPVPYVKATGSVAKKAAHQVTDTLSSTGSYLNFLAQRMGNLFKTYEQNPEPAPNA